MKVHITRSHIETAVERDSHHCMIADAVKSRFPDAKYISVDLQSIKFTTKKRDRWTFLTPPRAQINIIKFDQGIKSISPFSFELGEPVRVRTASRNKRSASKATRSHKRTGKYKGNVVRKERKFGIRMYKGSVDLRVRSRDHQRFIEAHS